MPCRFWDPAYTTVISRKPAIRALDVGVQATWKAFSGGGSRIPYLGVAAHQDWIAQNKALIPRLYKAYAQAAQWLTANPDEAAKLITPKSTPADHAALAASIRANDRLCLSLASADEIREEVQAVYRAGMDFGLPAADAVGLLHLRRAGQMSGALSHKRVLQFMVGTGGVATLWQIASLFFPDYLFPSIPQIVGRFVDIATASSTQVDVLTTAARIFAGLVGAFVCGVLLALVLNKSRAMEAYLTPVLVLLQGIPALSWVVIAVIWFHGTEFRIFFIMLVTTLPAFTFQILDAVRSMSKDLFEMTVAFRPTRWTLFRVLVLPTVVPGILTAWKVNIGNASRVVVVAELVGATGGVGYELLRQQQLFDMAGAIAWTLQLVTFVLVFQGLIAAIEAWALRWRPKSERAI